MKKILIVIFLTIFCIPLTLFSQTGWFQVYSGINPSLNALNSIAFSSQNTGFAAGGNLNGGFVVRTTNAGQNWNTVLTGSTAFQSVSFINDMTGYAVGGYNPASLIYKTTNSGQSWIQQSSGTQYCYFDSYFVDANTGFVTGDWGSIRKTTNGGNTWMLCNSGTSEYLYGICFANLNTGFAVGSVGQIMKSTDGGNNFQQLIQVGSKLNDVRFLNALTGYTVGTTGKVLKTTDGGAGWLILSTGVSNELTDLFIVNQNIIYISGTNGIILKTTNAGLNWVQQNVPLTGALLGVYFINDLTGYTCGANEAIFKTQTGGMSLPLPTLISPPNNSNNISLTPALAWSNINGVINYNVQVSTLSNFSVIVDSATVLINQRVIPPGKLQFGTTYFWRVRATNAAGTGPWTDPWVFGTITSINKISSEIPEKFKLYQNYPNPFNPVTKIKFDVPEKTYITIKVYNINGKEIAELFNGEVKPGKFETTWDASLNSSGVYILKLTSEKYSAINKLILTK